MIPSAFVVLVGFQRVYEESLLKSTEYSNVTDCQSVIDCGLIDIQLIYVVFFSPLYEGVFVHQPRFFLALVKSAKRVITSIRQLLQYAKKNLEMEKK